jgi:hypothetical protein
MAVALCYGSDGGGASLAFHHQVDAYNTNSLIGTLDRCARRSAGRRQPSCGTGYQHIAAWRCAPGWVASGTG